MNQFSGFSVNFISTWFPRHCGIANFTEQTATALYLYEDDIKHIKFHPIDKDGCGGEFCRRWRLAVKKREHSLPKAAKSDGVKPPTTYPGVVIDEKGKVSVTSFRNPSKIVVAGKLDRLDPFFENVQASNLTSHCQLAPVVLACPPGVFWSWRAWPTAGSFFETDGSRKERARDGIGAGGQTVPQAEGDAFSMGGPDPSLTLRFLRWRREFPEGGRRRR